MDAGSKIYKLREMKNISQEQLADLMNVSQVTVSNWEQGKSIKNEKIVELASVFQVPVEFLLDDSKKINIIQKNSDTAQNNINGFDVKISTPKEVIDNLFQKIDYLIDLIKKDNTK